MRAATYGVTDVISSYHIYSCFSAVM